jgi:hypothetical protein
VLGTARIARPDENWIHEWSPTQREKLFCGISGGALEKPPHIMLDLEQEELSHATISFDIDSVTAYLSSLAASRGGIRWYPVQRPTSDLQSSLHLDPLPVQYTDRHGHLHSIHAPLHQVKHYTLARVMGFEDASIYVFFPSLYDPQQQTSRLPDQKFQIWMDDILLPAIYHCHSSAQLQHYPSSFCHGQSNSWAAWTEERSVRTQARQQLLSYIVPAERLDEIWQMVLWIIQEKRLVDFYGVHLFLHAKNLKLVTKAGTWAAMRTQFQQTWEQAINTHYVQQCFLDIGKETCPMTSHLSQDEQSTNSQTLLWKRCCLLKYQRSQQPPDLSRATFYHLSFLQDSGSLTLETRPGTRLRQEGLQYSQFYCSVKEVFAAGHQYPFSNVMLEALALDGASHKTWQHLGRGAGQDPATLVQGYVHTKNRCSQSIHGSMWKSFGIREEHRVRNDLLEKIDSEFHCQNWAYKVFRVSRHRPFYIHRTSTVLEWFRWNMNKFCAGFEMVHSLQNQHIISWDHTQVMLLFLRCLRLAYGGGGNHLQRSFGCWRDVKEAANATGEMPRREGMGLCNTLQQYRYAWFLNKIHWKTMGFRASAVSCPVSRSPPVSG